MKATALPSIFVNEQRRKCLFDKMGIRHRKCYMGRVTNPVVAGIWLTEITPVPPERRPGHSGRRISSGWAEEP